MTKHVQKVVQNIQAFDARGALVQPGHIGVFEADKVFIIDPETGKKKDDPNLKDVGDYQPAIVEVAAIAPTGPNPQTPQQIPPDAVQSVGGGYIIPGKTLVAEGNAERREIDPKDEAKVTEALMEGAEEAKETKGASLNNDDDELVAGSVKDVTADLGGKTDEELDQLLAAEKDREKPRVGVTRAIEAEKEARASVTA